MWSVAIFILWSLTEDLALLAEDPWPNPVKERPDGLSHIASGKTIQSQTSSPATMTHKQECSCVDVYASMRGSCRYGSLNELAVDFQLHYRIPGCRNWSTSELVAFRLVLLHGAIIDKCD